MDPRIENLETTTFFGKRLTRKQIALMQETVELFPNDSRRELARTLCENFNWHTPSGTYREQFCLRVLEELEALGILTLPERRERGGRRGPPVRTEAGEPGEPVDAPLRDLEPVTLEVAAGGRDLAEWTELVDRYHPRGYRSPIGCHLAYFVLDRSGRRLGCLMFESPGALPARDAWIGWTERERDAGLQRVLRHSRFLVFPWVRVRNLASRSLSLAARRIADDWHRRWGVRPLLAETFVDPQEQEGSCYRAAGWTEIGATASRAPKDVYVIELEPDARAALRGERKETGRKPARAPESARTAAGMWSAVAAAAARTAERHDREWRVRRRLVGTFLVVLFVLRLVFGTGRSYGEALAEIWESARRMGVALPQDRPVTPGAMSRARAKVDPEVFRELHREILAQAPDRPLWKGRRVFGVDGAKINLPRPLVEAGYATPGDHAHYPQGLVSCLYELEPRLPFDFGLHADTSERRAAAEHLKALSAGDVVVYDRGYFSYEMLLAHVVRGQDAVFRLKRDANAETVAFLAGPLDDRTVEIRPDDKARARLKARHPGAAFGPLKLRLVRYAAGDTVFALGTTLAEDDGFGLEDLAAIYRARWRIEEHYKIAKWFLAVESFRAESERGVLQELYANFVMVTATRLMTNEIDGEINAAPDDDRPPKRVNFKHAAAAVFRNFEALALAQAEAVTETVSRIVDDVAALWQRERPGRSYPRMSRKPRNKWSRKGKVAAAS
ncbi:MAG: IS4 family transposase [Acidobacteria bacterium]|nr:IS4 family transposase [Acidobacteriota bacterium]